MSPPKVKHIPPKVMVGIIPETIKSATILVKDCELPKIFSAGTKGGVENANILVKVVICKNTFGGDKSPPKVCIENAMDGQREFVPAQHNFCRLATFGGDKGVAAKKLVARPPVCCSGR